MIVVRKPQLIIRTTENQELNAMLLHEVLARARMREDQQQAHQYRLARKLAIARRWRRLARYAERRALRVTALL